VLPEERRYQRGKDEKNDIWEHCEQAATQSLSVVNDEVWQPAGPTFCLARVSKRAGSRTLGSVR